MSEGAVAVEPSDGLQKRQRSDHEPWTTQMEAGVPSGNQLTMGGLTVRLRASDRGTLVEAVLLTVRFLLQSRNAGAIIGKGGSNINSLRKEFKASISVPDCPGPERILSIVADLDTLGEILLNIIPKLDDFAQHTGQNGGSESEMRLLMHQSHAGCIIGRAGCRIKELRESTGANIKVHGSCCPGSTERIVKVTGSPPVVVDCIKQICDIIGVAPIKGLNKPYDPHNFDPEFAQEYGGFGEGAAGGVSGGGGSLAGMSVGPTRGSSSRSGSMSFWRDEPVDAFARGRGPKRGPWGEASPQLPPHPFADEPARPWHSPPSLSSGGMHRDLPRSYRGGGMPRGGTYGRGNYNGR
ncbi:heterogeneous nuclear ribonucleoprotein K isoform X2 [Dermacentor silvarum]|uniref:heterogeneous nuclear ribonucleoprotein K isoform X2 n=1 Tax=Dermacentor silvarum TaxID=543639 RepID=UPI002101A1A7|nr:heterogeneous nuclear ribonucleoprotein K isoform X2 [Dermacentor silvarum]